MISTLPDSVRVRLYFFCDDEDLISIGLTNRQNNHLAIGYLIGKRYKVFCGASIDRLTGSTGQSRCLSKALHFAFFLNPHMRELAYSVMPVGRKGISQNLHHVQGFLSRCETLKTLVFHFEEMEKMLGGSEVAEEALGLGDAGGWLGVLADVLSLAVSKQCETIGMAGIRMIGLAEDFCPVSPRAQAALDGSDPGPAAPADDAPIAVVSATGYPTVCDIQDDALADGSPARTTPAYPDIGDDDFAGGRPVDATHSERSIPSSTPISTSGPLGKAVTLVQSKPQEMSNKLGFFKSFGRKLFKPSLSFSASHEVVPASTDLSDPIGFSANVVLPESNPIGASVPTARAVEALRAQSHSPAVPRVNETASQSRLKVLKVESAIFLQSPVVDWLIDAISSSPNLEEISFFNVYAKPAIWDRVVNSITRPNLHTFRVSHTWLIRRETGLSLSTLYHFLSRHPRLKALELYGLEMTAELSLFRSTQVPICPNLTKLSCHPFFATAILTDRGVSRGRYWNYPPITSIALYSESYFSSGRRQPFPLDLFDSALKAIGQNKRLPTLELELYIADNTAVKLNDWLQKHITFAHHGTGSCIAELTMVNSLVMRGDYISPDIQDKTFELLPAFVDLFPFVQHLELVEMHRSPEWTGGQRDPTKGFEAVLAASCPRLVSFRKDGSEKVLLDTLRAASKDHEKETRVGDAVVSSSSDLVIGV